MLPLQLQQPLRGGALLIQLQLLQHLLSLMLLQHCSQQPSLHVLQAQLLQGLAAQPCHGRDALQGEGGLTVPDSLEGPQRSSSWRSQRGTEAASKEGHCSMLGRC